MQITAVFESYEEMAAFAGKFGMPEVRMNNGAAVKNTPTQNIKKEIPVQEETQKSTKETQSEEMVAYTLMDVRAKLAELNKAGKREAVQTLIASYGAGKLTEVNESDYADLMEKAGEL